jgi:hypothetical protein
MSTGSRRAARKLNLASTSALPWPQLLALVAVAALFFWLQFSTPHICCTDFDGYYHIHWSQILWSGIRQGHFPAAFSWLPLTSLNPHDYADQHLLFHLLLIPFLWFTTPVMAAKASAAMFGTAAVFSCFWLVLHYRVRYALFWLIALLGSSSIFLYRMSMTRTQSLSIVFIVAGIVLLFEEKYRWLALLAFLYVWTYNLFVFLFAMALFWSAAVWWAQGRRELRPLLWTGIGIAAGLVVNPYFPHNIRLFFEHLTAKAGQLSLQAGTGMEWYALPSWDLATSCAVAFVAMLVGTIAFGFLLGRRGRSGMQRPLFFLLFATLLLLLAARSRRFIEYWPPFAVLFAAFTLQQVSEPPAQQEQKLKTRDHAAGTTRRKTFAATMVGLALVAVFLLQAQQARRWIQAPPNADKYRPAAQWMLEHVPRGATIFNASWDDFPILFYYDDSHAYVSGLDPIYLPDHNTDLGDLYERIAAGKQNHPGKSIHEAFGADYVLVSPAANRSFYVAALLSGEFTKVFEDKQCVVLKVRDLSLLNSE